MCRVVTVSVARMLFTPFRFSAVRTFAGTRSRRRVRLVVVSVRVSVASVRFLSPNLRAVALLTTSLARTVQRSAQRTDGRIEPPLPRAGRVCDGSGPSAGGGVLPPGAPGAPGGPGGPDAGGATVTPVLALPAPPRKSFAATFAV